MTFIVRWVSMGVQRMSHADTLESAEALCIILRNHGIGYTVECRVVE